MIEITNKDYWLKQQAELLPYQQAIITEDRSFNYEEVFELTKTCAFHFMNAGIGENDKVLLTSNNIHDFFISMNSLWYLGAIPIPFSAKMTEHEIDEIIDHSKSDFIIDPDEKYNLKKFHGIKTADLKFSSSADYDNEFRPIPFKPDRSCLLMYTSGSTGSPKCVELSFSNLFESAKSLDNYINHNKNDKWLVSLPVHHIGGFSILTRSLITGCSIIIPKSLNSIDVVNSIKSHEPTLLSCVPLMMKRLTDDFTTPWESLRHLFLGGGPVPEKVVSSALKKDWPVSVVYGSTETSSMVTVSSPENILENGISAGKPLEGVRISFISQNKNLDQSGRIVIDSKSVSRSYYNQPGEISGDLKGGKYYSCDIGKIDVNGNLKILGRVDEIIISGGENISLIEIRNLLHQNKEFADCRLFGIKHAKWDQSYIIITENKKHDIAEKIYEYLNLRIAKFKLPYKVIVMDLIPVNEMGKVSKNELKKVLKLDFL